MKRDLELSVFDIIGPVMIGPSSSHTAGAVRLGNLPEHLGHKPQSGDWITVLREIRKKDTVMTELWCRALGLSS